MDELVSKYFDSAEHQQKIINAEFKKGELLLKPNDQSKYLHSISKGLVKLYALDSRGKQNIGVIYGPEDLFPLAWIINQKRPAVYFEAITNCKVTQIPLKLFANQVKNNSELSYEFNKRITKQFALYATTVNNLGLKFGKERLAYRLLVLSSRFGQKTDGDIVIPYISNSDLGATVNMTRESVNIEMNKLAKLGLIEFDRIKITIKNSDKLHSLIGKNAQIYFYDNI